MVFCVFIFIFCLETMVKTTFVAVMVILFFESVTPKVLHHSCWNAPLQRPLKVTLQLKILRTWINIGVEPAPRHLTYYLRFSFSQTSQLFKFNLVSIE